MVVATNFGGGTPFSRAARMEHKRLGVSRGADVKSQHHVKRRFLKRAEGNHLTSGGRVAN